MKTYQCQCLTRVQSVFIDGNMTNPQLHNLKPARLTHERELLAGNLISQ